MKHGRRFLILVATAGGTLCVAAAPASAITLTVPPALSLPVPVAPLPLPVSGTVSVGEGGAPVQVGVTAPGSTNVSVTLPGSVSVSTPIGSITTPTLPLPTVSAPPVSVPTLPGQPVTTPTLSTPTLSAPTASAPTEPGRAGAPSSPTRGEPRSSVAVPSAASVIHAREISATKAAEAARVSAAIADSSRDSFLATLPAVVSRALLWGALAALAIAMQLLVSTAIARRRREPAEIS